MSQVCILRQHILIIIALLYVALAPSTTIGQSLPAQDLKRYTSDLPFTFPEIATPQIPDRSFIITSFGAVGDGVHDNTRAISDAIRECTKSGGGRVVVPQGMWLTGPIQFESHLNLVLEKGAVILFSNVLTDYSLVNVPPEGSEYKCISPISGINLTDVAITGEGIIDGAGEAWRPMKKSKYTAQEWKERVASGGVLSEDGNMWWPSASASKGEAYLKQLKKEKKKLSKEDYEAARDYLRPNLVKFVQCKNVLLDGPTFENSPAWNINPVFCENVIVRNIHIRNEWSAQNGDGIDFKSCRNVLMADCVVDAGDDGICLKSGRLYPSRALVPCENIVIANCTVYRAHGGFVIGSTVYGGIMNVSVKNCTFIGTDVGLRFKSSRTRGGIVENIFVDRITMRDIENEAIKFEMYYQDAASEQASTEDRTPQFRKIFMTNIVCIGAKSAGILQGLPESPLHEITIDGYTATSKLGLQCQDAGGITLKNLSIKPSEGPAFTFTSCKDLLLEKSICAPGANPFLRIEGEQNRNIQLVSIDMAPAKKDIEFTGNATPDAVIRK